MRGARAVTTYELCFFAAKGSEELDYAEGGVTPSAARNDSIPAKSP